MSEMVERIARAMCFGYPINCNNTGCPHAGRCLRKHDPRDGLMVEARLALAEIRNPTLAMIRAGRRKPELPPEEHRIGTADCDVNAILPRADDGRANSLMTELRYQAMIDEALK